MNPPHFDFEMLHHEDHDIAMQYLGQERQPDVFIEPDGHPYLYRWWLKPRDRTGAAGNLYFHIQVADDPERPLHDHPWDNMSVILAGGYVETMVHDTCPKGGVGMVRGQTYRVERKPGDVIFRRAAEPHHLRLLSGERYSMSQFATGPYLRPWGFHTQNGWMPFTSCIVETADGRSLYRKNHHV